MFGYVTFYRDELKIKDYDKFRAYYCGLCKQMGKSFNQLVRLGLSYDFTFLALLLDSLDCGETSFENQGCFKHMGKKRATVVENEAVSYAADMSIIFMYFKLLDDVRDDFSLVSAIAMIPYWFAQLKIKSKYGGIIGAIRGNLKELSRLEREECGNIDEIAHTFAGIMEKLFDCGGEDLKRLGYNLGRFIYIADAADDYEKDLKRKKYNPFKFAYSGKSPDEIREIAGRSMMMTLAMASENYEKLDVRKNKDLLDNIIYMGLRQKMDAIVCGKNCDKKGKINGKSL